MSAYVEGVAEVVGDLAERAGYDRAELARRSGLSRERVDLTLDGRDWPCPRTLHALAAALDVAPQDLVPDLSGL